MKIRAIALLAGTCLGTFAMVAPAYAQTTKPAAADAASDEDKSDKEEIVVTGSNIRGITPAGGNQTAVTKLEIEARGATSVTELLDAIPQISGGGGTQSFANGIPQVSAGQLGASFGSGTSVITPGLRQNPGDAESGSSTLQLVNGLRTSGTGITQNVSNPNTIPVSAIERVDVSLDGGSAIYGSDAIGGVLNYVIRRSYEGAEVSGKYGIGQGSYRNWDVNATLGHKWGNFSAYATYNYSGSKPLLNSEVSWFQPLDFSTGYELGTRCDTPNVQFGSGTTATGNLHFYPATATGIGATAFNLIPNAYSATLVGTPNLCSLGARGYKSPRTSRHNGLVGLAYDISPDLKLSVRGRYAESFTAAANGYIDNPGIASYAVTLTSRNPWYRPVPAGETANANEVVLGNFSSFIPIRDRESTASFKQWGAVGELLARLGGDWQGKLTFNYDESRSKSSATQFDTAAFNNMQMTSNTSTTPCGVAANLNFTTPTAANLAAAQAACFNPFNPSGNNTALLSQLNGGKLNAFAKDRIFQTRLVFDGTLVELAGGPLKVAAGGEYFVDSTSNGFDRILPVSGTTSFRPPSATQKVWSTFAEASVPLVGAGNALPLVRELRLSASGRYDHYNQYGGTFNPHFGVVWKPIDILALRGAWGKSFRAPTTMDVIASSPAGTQINFRTTSQVFPFSQALVNPNIPCVIAGLTATCGTGGVLTNLVTIQGTSPNLKPQHGKSWSIGGDFTPVRGLKASLTYYVTTYEDAFANPSLNPAYYTLGLGVYNTLTGTGTGAITQAVIDSFTAQGAVVTPQGSITPQSIYVIADIRTVNLKNTEVHGLDYSLRYDWETGFGSMYASISGTHNLSNKSVPYPGSPVVDNMKVTTPGGATGIGSDVGGQGRFTAQIGGRSGGFRTQITMTHFDGYSIVPTATVLQSSVGAFDQFGFFASYEFSDTAKILDGTQVSLTVTNLFNTAPPIYRTTTGTNNGHYGDTIGRVIQLGLRKRF